MSLLRFLRNLIGQKKPDLRTTSQLIYDLAEYGNRRADLRELYRRLPTMPLFAKVLSANFIIERGKRHTVTDGEILAIESAAINNYKNIVRFYVDESDKKLLPKYVLMTGREVYEMVLKIKDCDGLQLCNPSDSWVVLLRPEVQELLKQELTRAGHQPEAFLTSQAKHTP